MVVTRFVPFFRGPVYLATGLSGLGVARFFVLDAAAACVQVPLLLWLGSRLGEGATAPEAWARIGWASAALVGAALAVVVTRRAMVSVRAA